MTHLTPTPMFTTPATFKPMPQRRPLRFLSWGVCCWLAASACGAADTAPLRYHDGGVARTITLEPRWVADIQWPPDATAGQAQAKTAAGTAKPASSVTLRRVGQPVARSATVTATSPVYREGTSPAGRLMALPGGVIIKALPGWSEADVRSWASDQGLSIARPMNTGGGWYLMATAPGQPALTLANRLQAGGDVVFATPNWWRQTTTR